VLLHRLLVRRALTTVGKGLNIKHPRNRRLLEAVARVVVEGPCVELGEVAALALVAGVDVAYVVEVLIGGRGVSEW